MSANPIPTAAHNATTITRLMSSPSAPVEMSAQLSWLTGNIYPAVAESKFLKHLAL
jgi:hypothetical protein